MAAESPLAEFRVLGPLEVVSGGRPLPLSWPRLRALVALLVANAGRVVSVGALVESLWGEHAPPDARRTVRTYVSRLRQALRQPGVDVPVRDLITTCPPGYLLRLEPDAVDAVRFERMAAEGRRALGEGRHRVAAERLSAALAPWRGNAYGEFEQVPALRTEGARLDQLRLSVVEDRVDADLMAGMGGALIAELEDLTGRHPGHERLWGQLMRALYRAGRQTDALGAFRRARDALIDAAGVEPSPALTEIHQQILGHDPRLRAPEPTGPAGPTEQTEPAERTEPAPRTPAPDGRPTPERRPAQLPPAARGFAGRVDELAAMDALLTEGAAAPATVIAVLSGAAGIGKTTLAVRWAHRVADRFPDGHLYLNLRGFDPRLPPVTPAEAVRVFLDAFGLPPDRIPATVDAQASLYRSLLAGRRMLVVIDNAANPEQVRPLLPGTPGCVTVITSRNKLTGLVTTDGAHSLVLERISADQARGLLVARLGRDRVAAEPAAVDEIIARCAGLPLALAIVAARAAGHRRFPLATIAADLHAGQERLDALDTGDPATRIRALFTGSYQRLEADAARLFRLLGLHPGPHVTVAAAASLAAVPIGRVRALLADLTSAHLLEEDIPGQFGFHDLLRLYADELANRDDPDGERLAATQRMLDHYLHTAHAAVTRYDPAPDLPVLPPPPDSIVVATFADLASALAWLSREHGTLAAMIRRADDVGLDTYTSSLASTMASFFAMRGYSHELSIAQHAALAAARRRGDPASEADAHRMLGVAQFWAARFDKALEHHHEALELLRTSDDLVSLAYTHHSVGLTLHEQHRYREALDHAERSLRFFRDAGHPRQVLELAIVGVGHAMLGDNDRALACGTRALALHETMNDPLGISGAWWCLGQAHHNLGRYAEAIADYRRLIAVLNEYGGRQFLAESFLRLGNVYADAGQPDDARDVWQRSLALFAEFGHPNADRIRAKLFGLAGRQSA